MAYFCPSRSNQVRRTRLTNKKSSLEKAEANVPVDDAVFAFPRGSCKIITFMRFLNLSALVVLCFVSAIRAEENPPLFFGHHLRVERSKYRFGDDERPRFCHCRYSGIVWENYLVRGRGQRRRLEIG